MVVGFLGPVTIAMAVGLLYPALGTAYRSFQVVQAAVGPDGKPIINPNTGQKTSGAGLQPCQLRQGLHRPGLPEGSLNTVLVGDPGAGGRDRLRPDLCGPGRPDPGREAGEGARFLPMAISMVGASHHLEIHVRVSARPTRPQIGLLNQILVWLGMEPYQFIITEPWNTFFLIIVMIWIQAGFAMTVLSAAIKSVPDDIVEAAQIDGATGFKLFRKVTVPTIRPGRGRGRHHHRHGFAESLRHRQNHDRR